MASDGHFTTNYFDDATGEWRQRYISPSEVLEGETAMRGSRPNNLPGQAEKGPEYGVLTHTVATSSVIQAVFPARIRSKDQRDVIFVAENYIELRVLNHSCLLETVARKTDFGSDIRCAKVLWTIRKQLNFDVDCILHGGPEDYDQQRHLKELSANQKALPPQIILLTLGSGNLMFLYAKDVGSEVVWITSMLKVAQDGSYLQQLGSHMAVDPFSRAVALAAWDGYVRLYSVCSTAEMREQARTGSDLMPLNSEHTFKVGGTIGFMEFLCPQQKESVLLLIYLVDMRKQSRLLLFEWSESKPLDTARQHGQDGLKLPAHLGLPLLLVPTRVGTSVMLVCEHAIYIVCANDIVSGNVNFQAFPIPALAHRPALWNQSLITAWTRPFRAPSYASHHDDIYILKENADIFYLEVTRKGSAPVYIESASVIGNAECTGGKAFSCLDYGLKRRDVVCVPGEASDGRTIIIKPSNGPGHRLGRMQVLPNWSPIVDFELVSLRAPDAFHSMSTRDRIFACTGRGEFGAVSEIRYGKEALATDILRCSGVPERMWLFSSQRLHYIMTSEVTENTYFVKIRYSHPENEDQRTEVDGEPDEVLGTDIGLSEKRTLAAGFLNNKIVQVTKGAIHLSRTISDENNFNDERIQFFDDGGVTMAAVRKNIVALVRQVDDGWHLEMGLLSETEYLLLTVLEAALIIPSEPSFLEVLELDGSYIAILGTVDCDIYFSHLDAEQYSGVRLLYQHRVELPASMQMNDENENICESAVILSNPNSFSTKLVCGLRNGIIASLDIRWNQDSLIDVENPEFFQLGKIPVRLVQKPGLANKCLAHTNHELYELELERDDLKISQVVFTTDVKGTQPVIEAISYFNNEINFEPFTDSILCITTKGTLIAAISRLEGVCKRSMELNETPRKLLYYEPMNLLVVACWKSTPAESFTADSSPHKKRGMNTSPMSTLKFIDPRNGDVTAERDLKDHSKNELIFSKSRERIYALANWTVEQDTKKFKFILVGTGFVNSSDPTKPKGRLIVLAVSNRSQTVPSPSGDDGGSELGVEVRRKFHFNTEGPVSGIAGFGGKSIIYVTGNVLSMKTLNLATKKFEGLIECKLQSAATDISVNEPFVAVSCVTDSLVVFKVENGAFTMFCRDPEPRSGYSHIQLSNDIYMVSDKDVGVLGLWQPPTRRTRTDMPITFDTEMLSSICKFKAGNVRPLWHLPHNASSYSRPPGLAPFEKDVIGAGVDGAIYHFTLITLGALNLLKVLVTLYYLCDPISGVNTGGGGASSGPNGEASRHVEYYQRIVSGLKLKPEDRSVSGDILVSVYRRGDGWLRNAMGPPGTPVYNTVEELVRALLGPVASNDPVSAVRNYIKQLLMKTVTP